MAEEAQSDKPSQNQKIVEKYYIEVNASGYKKFMVGLLGGLGWGIGLTVGTSIFLIIISFFISKVNFIPIFGQFLADVIKSAQNSLIK